MDKLRPWLLPLSSSILCLTLAICAAIITHNLRIGIHQLNDTLTDAKAYVHSEKDRLEDPKNAKALDAAIQAGAVLNASGRYLNTQLLPAGLRTLNAATDTIAELKRQAKQ